MKIKRGAALLAAVVILVVAGFCALKMHRDSQLQNDLLSAENNVAVMTVEKIRIVVANKNYFQNDKGDRVISKENVKVRLERPDGISKYITAYDDTSKFLFFIIPSSYDGKLFVEFVSPEKYKRNDEEDDKGSTSRKDYIDDITEDTSHSI
jgi:hypothetical protein